MSPSGIPIQGQPSRHATGRRLYQCPGCFSYAYQRAPARDGWLECSCGERMTLIDLRARTTDGPHGKNWHEDER